MTARTVRVSVLAMLVALLGAVLHDGVQMAACPSPLADTVECIAIGDDVAPDARHAASPLECEQPAGTATHSFAAAGTPATSRLTPPLAGVRRSIDHPPSR